MEIIRKKEIDQALARQYRQYLTGHLEKPQPNLQHIDDDIEVGISEYEHFTADIPHVHPVCTEHTYVLKGAVKIRFVETGEEQELREGDFAVLRPNTPYATKNAPDTKVLFIKTPANNDKTLIRIDEATQQWLQTWE